MKKIFTILLVLISFSTFAQFEAGEYVNSDTLKNKGSSIIYPHADSVEQFYYSKMRDPSEPLDGVNLRTLFDRLASLDTLGLNVSDLVSGSQLINAGETQIFFPSAFDSTNVIVVPFVRRISDNAVIDFIINDIDSLGFDVVVWEDSCKIQYVASQKITHSSDIFKEPIYSADSAYLKLHVKTDFDTDSTNEIQDLSGLVPFLGADRDVDLGANSINTDTVKIDGVPLLLNTFKQGNLGGAGNIFYSTGASSQPASGSLNQVAGGGLLNANSVVKWDGNKFANSIIQENATGVGINTSAEAPLTIKQINDGVGFKLYGYSVPTNYIKFYLNDLGNPRFDTNASLVFVSASSTVFRSSGLYFQNNSNITRLFIDSNGIIAIGTTDTDGTPSTGRLTVKGSTNDGSTNIFVGRDSDENNVFSVDTDGNIDVNGNLITDTIKARADIIVTGEIYDKINHLYGMVYDSTITLSLTQNVWQQVTNATKTLYSTAEQDGVTISSDTIVFSKAGGYDVSFEFNCTGINSKDYHYRILQKNGTTTVRSYNKYASTGTQVLRNEKAYIHVAAGSKVWCEIMSPSSAPGNVTIQGAKVYAMQCYLEK